ncbi:Aminotransferase-like [Hirschfeldia incana]|nr:Aminotransferase-like [Hirschfeldia incana]
MLPRQNPSPADLKSLSLSVSFKGWRFPNKNFKSWAIKMSSLHKPTWIQAGIFEAVIASTKAFPKDTDLLVGLAEKWCPDTNTFVFPWGEATITLEDVMFLLGFSVLGSPVFASLDNSGERVKEELVKESVKIKKDSNFVFVSQVEWISRFMNIGGELEHVAFLALWLSYFVFPSSYYHVDEAVFSVAVHVARGNRIALAPAVLAHLYADLTLLKQHIREFTVDKDKIELKGLFKLVQVWTWERFKELQPEKPNQLLLLKGEPRLSLWCDGSREKRSSNNVREVLEESKVESFEWRPYTKALENWRFPLFYPEDAMWVAVDGDLDDEFMTFARCVKVSKLVGIDCVEDYFPNRVAAQFGLLQDDVTCPVKRRSLSKEAAWDEYNKPLDELTLYIPSRCVRPWWKKSSSEWWKKLSPAKENQAVESAESLIPRNIIGDDDDDTSDSVSSSCKRWKSMKELCEDDEDDSLTVAQVMRLRKKNKAMCSSDEKYSSDLLLSEVLKKLGDGFPEKLKRSRTRRNVMRSEIKEGNCGDTTASREVPLGDLFDKELVKVKSENLGKKRAREEDCYYNVNNAEKMRVETVVAPRKIKQESEETETRSKAASEKYNSLDPPPPLGAKVEVVETAVSPPETRQRNNATEELALTLETRMMKVEKTLAKIREWKTIEINRVSA